MGIGASIFLIAVGLILALAVHVHVAGLDVSLVGWILAAVGLVGLIATMVLWGRSRNTVTDQPRVVREEYPPRY